MKRLLLLSFVALTAMSASAYKSFVTYQGRNIYFNELSRLDIAGQKIMLVELTYYDTNYNSYSGDVKLPDEFYYDGYRCTFTNIGKHAFENCTDLTSVDFGIHMLVTIDDSAFYNCPNLSLPKFPSTLSSIGKSAFEECDNIKELTFSQKITLSERSFYRCSNLETLTIADNSCEDIPNWCFANCSNLKKVYIGNSVKNIDTYAFTEDMLINDLTINSDYVTNKVHSFDKTLSIIFFDGPSTTTRETDDLSLTFGDDVKVLGKNAFYGTYVKKLNTGDGMERIDTYNFFKGRASREGSQEIIIGKNMKEIGEQVFQYIKTSTVTEYAYNLTKLTINSPYLMTKDEFIYNQINSHFTELVIGEGITEIGSKAISNSIGFPIDTYYRRVSLPSTLEYIRAEAFYKCAITTIEIPAKVKQIGGEAFGHCKYLTSINDLSNAEIDNSAFDGVDKEKCFVFVTSAEQLQKYRKMGFKRVICGSATDGNTDEDVNHDGQVNSLDALKVYKYIQMH